MSKVKKLKKYFQYLRIQWGVALPNAPLKLSWYVKPTYAGRAPLSPEDYNPVLDEIKLSPFVSDLKHSAS